MIHYRIRKEIEVRPLGPEGSSAFCRAASACSSCGSPFADLVLSENFGDADGLPTNFYPQTVL